MQRKAVEAHGRWSCGHHPHGLGGQAFTASGKEQLKGPAASDGRGGERPPPCVCQHFRRGAGDERVPTLGLTVEFLISVAWAHGPCWLCCQGRAKVRLCTPWRHWFLACAEHSEPWERRPNRIVREEKNTATSAFVSDPLPDPIERHMMETANG